MWNIAEGYEQKAGYDLLKCFKLQSQLRYFKVKWDI